jgi:hypothetical protein
MEEGTRRTADALAVLVEFPGEENVRVALLVQFVSFSEAEILNVYHDDPHHQYRVRRVIVRGKRTPFDTPSVVRVPFVISENIRSEYPSPVGKDGLPGALHPRSKSADRPALSFHHPPNQSLDQYRNERKANNTHQEGVKTIIESVMLIAGANIPCAVRRFGMTGNDSLLLCNNWMLTNDGSDAA